MQTWKDMNPDFIHLVWNEAKLEKKRGFKVKCVKQIAMMPEWNGKADILRWEILEHYGGVFLDADSVCMHYQAVGREYCNKVETPDNLAEPKNASL